MSDKKEFMEELRNASVEIDLQGVGRVDVILERDFEIINQRHEEQMKERVIKSLLSFAHSGELPDTFCYRDEEILTGLEKWYNEKYGSDER